MLALFKTISCYIRVLELNELIHVMQLPNYLPLGFTQCITEDSGLIIIRGIDRVNAKEESRYNGAIEILSGEKGEEFRTFVRWLCRGT